MHRGDPTPIRRPRQASGWGPAARLPRVGYV